MDEPKAKGLKVAGASELRRLFRAIQEPNLTNELKDVHYRVAEIVVNRARGNAARLGRRARPSASSRNRRVHRYGGLPAPLVAAATLHSSRRQTGASVSLGSVRVPFALGQEFGAHPDRQRTAEETGRRFVGYRQFPAVNKRGYFLYPAIADAKDEIAKEYLDGIDAIVAKTK